MPVEFRSFKALKIPAAPSCIRPPRRYSATCAHTWSPSGLITEISFQPHCKKQVAGDRLDDRVQRAGDVVQNAGTDGLLAVSVFGLAGHFVLVGSLPKSVHRPRGVRHLPQSYPVLVPTWSGTIPTWSGL